MHEKHEEADHACFERCCQARNHAKQNGDTSGKMPGSGQIGEKEVAREPRRHHCGGAIPINKMRQT